MFQLMKSSFIKKVRRRFWSKLVSKTRKYPLYPYIYWSTLYALIFRIQTPTISQNYLCARPNPGAGIGHQLANWIAGYWYAKRFELKFAHIPFSSDNWEHFLGFGEDEISVKQLINDGYKKVKLPLFREDNPEDVSLIRNIIDSYNHRKVIFICEQDQYYKDQHGVMTDIKRKFHSAKARSTDRLIYSKESINIAIHVRRGDIVAGQQNGNINHQMRWQDNNYFVKVLHSVISHISANKPLAIYLFSQGIESDFKEFNQFKNLHFCLDMSPQDSFLHMVYADVIITSKSSFSYKPALLSNGIKICPENFWHGYPNTEDWILADKNGEFNQKVLKSMKL